nr:YetF domain-containing protein [Polyangium spumosum]
MNAFDFIVTVALGSSLATVILSKDVPLVEGVVGFALLIGLQYLVTWTSVRSGVVRRLVKSEPKLLFHRGEMLERAMRRERVLEAELLAAVRDQGIASLAEVEAVVLETDGTISVIRRSDATGRSTLRGVASPLDRG